MNYYNEFDAKAAAWLRELIKQGLIPNGYVDERSITEIKPSNLVGYTQCHFFAGIGGWNLALQLAGWPPDRRVWTGSCPCQPFSAAGKGFGDKDERHLWPVLFNLIKECRPQHVFGEQVASAIGKGWLDGISADLESENYACGAVVLGAHSVGAPHIRQRLYWMADMRSEGLEERQEQSPRHECQAIERGCDVGGIYRVANAKRNNDQRHAESANNIRQESDGPSDKHGRCGGAFISWTDSAIIECRDGKARRIPTEPAFFPLANGISARVVRLRGYGNAIVPQVAAEFISAYMD